MVVKKPRPGLFVRPANRTKRVAIFSQWLREKKAFTRTIFVDESHVWLDPLCSRVILPKYSRYGHVIPKPKHVPSVTFNERAGKIFFVQVGIFLGISWWGPTKVYLTRGKDRMNSARYVVSYSRYCSSMS